VTATQELVLANDDACFGVVTHLTPKRFNPLQANGRLDGPHSLLARARTGRHG
jgi:hypothetical protein